jgi:hypothetical protein
VALTLHEVVVRQTLGQLFDEDFGLHDRLADVPADVLQRCRQGTADVPPQWYPLSAFFRTMTRFGEEPFVELVVEWLLKGASEQAWSPALVRFPDAGEPLEAAEDLYTTVWGPLPPGPSPIFRYGHLPETKIARRRDRWTETRNELYGPPPYDRDRLRAMALEPADGPVPLPAGRIERPGWVAYPEGDGYELTFDPGAHVPQLVTVEASADAIRSLLDGAALSSVTLPLIRSQNIRIL